VVDLLRIPWQIDHSKRSLVVATIVGASDQAANVVDVSAAGIELADAFGGKVLAQPEPHIVGHLGAGGVEHRALLLVHVVCQRSGQVLQRLTEVLRRGVFYLEQLEQRLVATSPSVGRGMDSSVITARSRRVRLISLSHAESSFAPKPSGLPQSGRSRTSTSSSRSRPHGDTDVSVARSRSSNVDPSTCTPAMTSEKSVHSSGQ